MSEVRPKEQIAKSKGGDAGTSEAAGSGTVATRNGALSTDEQVKRYDCTSGGAQFCQGCYQMEQDEQGDYVRWEDYERLQSALKEIADGGWNATIEPVALARAALEAKHD